MKNLRKTLALALVLVMALGMVPLASANSSIAVMNVEDFTDADAIQEQYVEAADVLASLGVYQGDRGAFRPQDTITRAESAALMARIMLGYTTAEALPLTATGFRDVPAGHWAAGYISFGVEIGILAGHGDGTFRPNDPITGFQVGKLLLGALGYGLHG